MPGSTLEVTDRLWRGEAGPGEINPLRAAADLDEVADRTGFIPAFGNVSAFAVDGALVLVDTGSEHMAVDNHRKVRAWSNLPLDTVVYTHGHIDHVFGLAPFEAEAERRGRPRPRVLAHELVPARFDRYRLTAGYNGIVNGRQFKLPGYRWPTEYRYPDETYRLRHDVEIGGERFELHHGKGETDDHTWVWVPGRRVLCTGDMFIWASPNCGNPQKVQRYPREWAQALREMDRLGAELLLPGHGWPIAGADRVHQALTDTADLLDHLVDETLALMNAGARLDDIVHAVHAPGHLLERPYLRPIYDEPEFVVRTVWRLYGGWYDGDPAHLKPAPAAALARELAELAGGAGVLADRAGELAAAGDLRLAGHLAELAAQAAPDDPGVHRVRAAVFGRRAGEERSTMSRGIFSWAADESQARLAAMGD
ncbi:MAG TPA: alkyl sulfatase dimerization domain-containing protein [Acidimicrobiales bacterium]|nr:alkyl sulfatase dimerization domain-containing protein [Acidimicrobiales bacterium]